MFQLNVKLILYFDLFTSKNPWAEFEGGGVSNFVGSWILLNAGYKKYLLVTPVVKNGFYVLFFLHGMVPYPSPLGNRTNSQIKHNDMHQNLISSYLSICHLKVSHELQLVVLKI